MNESQENIGWPEDAMCEWMGEFGPKPVTPGIYRTRMYTPSLMKVVEGWTYFDGAKWRLQYRDYRAAACHIGAAVFGQTPRAWRGLTQYEYNRARAIVFQIKNMQVEKVFGIIDNSLGAEH
jgi:hypothetical protein